MKKIIAIFLFLFMVASGASASPTVFGSTGMINNPSADVLRSGHISAGTYHFDKNRSTVCSFGLNDQVEFGLAAMNFSDRGNKVYWNAKFGLLAEKVLLPGVVFGIEDIASTDRRSFYAVTSKALPFGYRLHLGMGNGRFDGIFAGLEKKVFPGALFIAEFDGRGMNYGTRLTLAPGVKLNVGWRASTPFLGITYSN